MLFRSEVREPKAPRKPREGQGHDKPAKRGRGRPPKAKRAQDAPNGDGSQEEKGNDGPPTSDTAVSPGGQPTPANLKMYTEYLVNWLNEAESVAQINSQWLLDRTLRNACGIVEEERKQLREQLVDVKIAELTDAN